MISIIIIFFFQVAWSIQWKVGLEKKKKTQNWPKSGKAVAFVHLGAENEAYSGVLTSWEILR